MDGVDQYPSGTVEKWVVTHGTQVPGDTSSSWVSRSLTLHAPPSLCQVMDAAALRQ